MTNKRPYAMRCGDYLYVSEGNLKGTTADVVGHVIKINQYEEYEKSSDFTVFLIRYMHELNEFFGRTGDKHIPDNLTKEQKYVIDDIKYQEKQLKDFIMGKIIEAASRNV